MNVWRVAEEFRLYLAGHLTSGEPTFAGVFLSHAQSSDTVQLPAIWVNAAVQPLAGSDHVGTASINFVVESHSEDTAAAAHAALVEKLRLILFGDAPGMERLAKQAVTAAINAAGRLRVDGYAAAPADLNVEQHAFKTPLSIIAGVRSV
jgi:capsular polysaccharide biosynthesis protein